ncbi:MAG: ATPase, T2SS/T4P/T4SS family, partial [Lentisphaeria bacterium]
MPEMEIDTSSSAIWHLLLDSGKATEEQFNEVYEEHERTGKAFTTVLYNYEIVTEQELLEIIADNLGTEVVDIKEMSIPREVINKIGAATARMYSVIPVREEGGVLYVAAKDPLNYRMVDELHYVVGQDCRILVAPGNQIDDALDHFYPRDSDSVSDVLAEMDADDIQEIDEGEDVADEQALEEMANNAPIMRFVDVVLYQAIKDRASDIHFEPFANEFKIRYRIDGALYEMAPPPKHLAVPVISRIKVLSNLNIAERRKPQDGRIELRIAGKPIDLRVSTLPTQYGESVVMRVLDRSNVQLDLEKIGMDAKDLEQIRAMINQP